MFEAEKRSLKYASLLCFPERQRNEIFHVHGKREKGKIDNSSCCWDFHPFSRMSTLRRWLTFNEQY